MPTHPTRFYTLHEGVVRKDSEKAVADLRKAGLWYSPVENVKEERIILYTLWIEVDIKQSLSTSTLLQNVPYDHKCKDNEGHKVAHVPTTTLGHHSVYPTKSAS